MLKNNVVREPITKQEVPYCTTHIIGSGPDLSTKGASSVPTGDGMFARYKKHIFWASYASRILLIEYVRIINCIRPPLPLTPFPLHSSVLGEVGGGCRVPQDGLGSENVVQSHQTILVNQPTVFFPHPPGGIPLFVLALRSRTVQ